MTRRPTSPTAPKTEGEIRITAMTYGPHGVGRLAGKAVFVRGVVPGERVDVEVREQHGSFSYAELRAIRASAPERRSPPCVYLPACGGCPWQHLSYPAQLAAKSHNLRDALRRIADLCDVPCREVLSSPAEFGYRSRLSLRVDNRHVGFYAGASHDLVRVDHCLLGEPSVNAAIPLADDLVGLLASNARRVEIALRGFAAGVVFSAEVEGEVADSDDAVVTRWLRENPSVAAVVLGGQRRRRVWGDDRIQISPTEGIALLARAGSFTQVNPLANRLLVQTVLDFAEAGPDTAVLDLYSGVGNLGLPLARRVARLTAMEQDPAAIEAARVNVSTLALENVTLLQGPVHKGLRALPRDSYFDVVVLDPPRSGAADALDGILRLSPRRIVYVSCNPSTLARDLARLKASYRIDVVQPLDLFPQTYHLETVVRATRR